MLNFQKKKGNFWMEKHQLYLWIKKMQKSYSNNNKATPENKIHKTYI